MPSIIYNGENGTEPHYSKEIVTDQQNFKNWLVAEKERILADIPAFEADLQSNEPELRLGAETNIDSINRKSEKLQIIIDSI
jgi:hypothetical protein